MLIYITCFILLLFLFYYYKRSSKRCLLILDLNNVLIYRKHISSMEGVDRTYSIRKYNTFIWKRPGADAFLQWCSAKGFDIAIWSSIAERNIEPILEILDVKPVFVWNQSHCAKITPHPDPTSDKPDCLIKPLDVLWKNSWWYNKENTFIIDDCKYKMACNPAENVILVEPWNKDVKNDMGLHHLKQILKEFNIYE